MSNSVRIDKWLWAARFFKTRSLAKAAIEGGKVHIDGQRCKASKEVTVGMVLRIRQGWDEKTVEVLALSDQRRGAPEAALLYRETEESERARLRAAEQRRLSREAWAQPPTRPNKKDRRALHRLRDDLLDS